MSVNFYLEGRSGKSGDCPIRVSINMLGVRFLTSIGYAVNKKNWNRKKQLVRKATINEKGIVAEVINLKLAKIKAYFIRLENEYRFQNKVITLEELRSTYQAEFGRFWLAKSVQKKQTIFFHCLQDFLLDGAQKYHWSESTLQKIRNLAHHLRDFNPDLDFEKPTEDCLLDYVSFLLNEKNMRNSTAKKQLDMLRWFLNWASQKGYHQQDAFRRFSLKLKDIPRKIVFLDWEELMLFYHFPLDNPSLDRVRDVFCFCCFTSLRYSDVAKLKRADISAQCIHLTTQKTSKLLRIELNDYAKAILTKYENESFDKDLALPVLSSQRMNISLKEIGRRCALDTPTTITYYKGNRRIDEVYPKYELLSTHAGRRSFVCNALMLGISPQVVMKWTGHSDYKAMKPYIDVADATAREAMGLFNRV